MSLLSTDRIGLMEEASSAVESISVAGKYLEKAGYITDGYTDAMIKNMETNGPYFVLAPSFAMPHARPEEGVIKSGVSLITLKTPVNFGSDNDPVKVVMALATGSNEEHMEYMSKIAAIFSKKGIIDSLYNCGSSEEVLEIIE